MAEALPGACLMAFIVLWPHDDRQCVLAVGGRLYQCTVRLLDVTSGLLREEPATDPDHALRLATVWYELELRGASGLYGAVGGHAAPAA